MNRQAEMRRAIAKQHANTVREAAYRDTERELSASIPGVALAMFELNPAFADAVERLSLDEDGFERLDKMGREFNAAGAPSERRTEVH